MYLRGQLSVDMGLGWPRGRAAAGLAGGVGDYVVRVYARNRREVCGSTTRCSSAGSTRLATSFQQARKNLEGLEQYLLQFWREY